MLDNCCYNDIKVLCELSKLAWFLEHHGISDAKTVNNNLSHDRCKELLADLKKHIALFEAVVCKK